MGENADFTRNLLPSVTTLFCARYRKKNVQDVQQYVTQITGLKNKRRDVHSECVTTLTTTGRKDLLSAFCAAFLWDESVAPCVMEGIVDVAQHVLYRRLDEKQQFTVCADALNT